MKRIIFLSITILIALYAIAALPPQYQNLKDLDVMVDFIEKYPKIASTLKSIDMLEYTIYFGNDCKAEFGRRSTRKPQGWVGPADPLEFKKSNCSVE